MIRVKPQFGQRFGLSFFDSSALAGVKSPAVIDLLQLVCIGQQRLVQRINPNHCYQRLIRNFWLF